MRTVAGCGPGAPGAVWFGAHPEFDTPDENVSASLHAMALALMTGRGWESLRAGVRRRRQRRKRG